MTASEATMKINQKKTEFMVVDKHLKITPTTEEDVDLMDFKYHCDRCMRKFPSQRSVYSHLNAHWCPNDPNTRIRIAKKYKDPPKKIYRTRSTKQSLRSV